MWAGHEVLLDSQPQKFSELCTVVPGLRGPWALLGPGALPWPALLPEHCRLSSTESQAAFYHKATYGRTESLLSGSALMPYWDSRVF